MNFWKNTLHTLVQGRGAPESIHTHTGGMGGLKSGVLVHTYFMDAPIKH